MTLDCNISNIIIMPAKNIVKKYIENGYYHIYNRGVEKRIIFKDKEDYSVFLHYLKLYLSTPEELHKNKIKKRRPDKYIKKNLSEEVILLSFVLMPNHFHLLVKQQTKDGITKLMRRLITAYVMYFNKKQDRIGPLFQSAYKAALIDKEEYLLHITRYIHLNPKKNLKNYSSYPYYLGDKHASWIKPDLVLEYFKETKKQNNSVNSYQQFVEDYKFDSEKYLADLILES